jgi:tetratricopeptide (TPR) repeat protein
MKKQELLKQADCNFQRGNRELAKKYLDELISTHPNEEAAWMLLARVVEEKERKIECYERVIKINPNNTEAKIGLFRIQYPDKTIPKRRIMEGNLWQASKPFNKNILRGMIVTSIILLGLGTTTFAIARNNPESNVAKLIILTTSTPFTQTLADDVAAQTRADVSEKYPEYAPLVDTLIRFAINNAESGMDGAPERPGAPIVPSDSAGIVAKTTLENALPQPGSLSTATLTEQQITSWLAMEMKNNPDLPLSDVQVYLRDGTIQIWGLAVGNADSTSALVIGKINVDTNGNPSFELESLQIGQQVIPNILLSQAETWLNQLLAEKINKQMPGLQIMNINISNGLITISGMR